ncbi:MAG TPA: IS3 family transposase, partial [Anaerolineae bacterium]|nr:IS3 family transposase [Anaerolineae bacterium]
MIKVLCPTYPLALVCEALDCARSSHYCQGKKADQAELVAAIQEVLIEWPTYGYRRVTAQLQRQ